MKSVSEVTAIVHDNDSALFLPLAERLSRDYGRVLYVTHRGKGFEKFDKACIGDGIPGVELVPDLWRVKDECDLFIFPDCNNSGIQLELESQGLPVWGPRTADDLELNRELFMRVIEKVGLAMPEFEVIEGVSELRLQMRDKEDCYIKISRYRGSMETYHWRSWKLDEYQIDVWAMRFGPGRERIRFLVFEAINTPLEDGGDCYGIDGRWPSLMLHGVEAKDRSYFGAVTDTEQMPEQLKEVLDAFKSELARHRFRSFWSMEVRIKDGVGYFGDPTCRGGLPSSASQMELWGNLGEIIWAGAHGELVEPEPTGKFSCEVILKVSSDKEGWPRVEIPEQLRQWMKLACHCEDDGVAWFPPDSEKDDAKGWLVSIGDTPKEALETLKEHISELPDGLSADIAPIAEVISAIEHGESEGVEFTKKPMPQPVEVLDNS